jgi:signal transduction histidine kinase
MRSLVLEHSTPNLERTAREAARRERRRIGQELHDNLCQNLLGAAFTVKAVADKLPPDSAEAVELEMAVRLVNAAVQQARDIALGLNPDASPERP